MYKLALFDIDGTLTKEDSTIDPAVIDAVQKAGQNGTRIILASGRPTFGMLELAKTFALDKNDGYIISYNGCALYHVPTQKYIIEHFMDEKIVKQLSQAVLQHPEVAPIYYENEKIVTTARNQYVDFEAEVNGTVAYDIDHTPLHTPKVIWAAEPSELDAIEAQVREQFGELCTIARSLPCFLEFTPHGIDKGFAIEEVCERLGVDIADTFACGDGGNDKTMIERAGIGVAMANGREDVKAVADFIAPPNSENGVIVAIEKYLL